MKESPIDLVNILGMMKQWIEDADTYDERKVECFQLDKLIVSTVKVNDAEDPYETAVQHPDYNDGKYIVVASYRTKKLARTGHFQWVKIMTSKPLPSSLVDIQNAFIAKLLPPEEMVYPRKATDAGN